MTNINTAIADEHSLSGRVEELSRSLRLYDSGLVLEPQGVWSLCGMLDDFAADAAAIEGELRALRPVPPRPRPLLYDIIGVVAEDQRVSRELIMADDRRRDICKARHMVFWLAREVTSLSCTQIGQRMASRDHATVLNGIRRTDDLAARDAGFRRRLDRLAERLLAEAATVKEQAA